MPCFLVALQHDFISRGHEVPQLPHVFYPFTFILHHSQPEK